jgi:hypothetical protein
MGGRVNRAERRGANLLSAAVVAVFVLFGALGVATSGPPGSQDGWVTLVVNWAVFATPSVFAVRILWRAWWAQTGARLSTMDAPARLLAAAVATLPAARRSAAGAGCRGARDGRGRRRRAGGRPRPARGTGVRGDLRGARRRHGHPGGGPFAAAPPAGVRPTVAATGVAGVAACIAAIGYMLAADPSAAQALGLTHAVVLAVLLAGSLWLVLTPPRGLASSRLARRVGLGAALALGLGLLVSTRVPDRSDAMFYLLLAPVAIFFLGSAIAAAAGRSLRVGVQAVVWAALQADLSDAVFWVLVSIPVWALPFGVFGAALGTRLASRQGRSHVQPRPFGPQPCFEVTAGGTGWSTTPALSSCVNWPTDSASPAPWAGTLTAAGNADIPPPVRSAT